MNKKLIFGIVAGVAVSASLLAACSESVDYKCFCYWRAVVDGKEQTYAKEHSEMKDGCFFGNKELKNCKNLENYYEKSQWLYHEFPKGSTDKHVLCRAEQASWLE